MTARPTMPPWPAVIRPAGARQVTPVVFWLPEKPAVGDLIETTAGNRRVIGVEHENLGEGWTAVVDLP